MEQDLWSENRFSLNVSSCKLNGVRLSSYVIWWDNSTSNKCKQIFLKLHRTELSGYINTHGDLEIFKRGWILCGTCHPQGKLTTGSTSSSPGYACISQFYDCTTGGGSGFSAHFRKKKRSNTFLSQEKEKVIQPETTTGCRIWGYNNASVGKTHPQKDWLKELNERTSYRSMDRLKELTRSGEALWEE